MFSTRRTRYFHDLTGGLNEIAKRLIRQTHRTPTDRTEPIVLCDALISRRTRGENSSLSAPLSVGIANARCEKLARMCERAHQHSRQYSVTAGCTSHLQPAAPCLVPSRICIVIANYQSSFVHEENRGSTSKLTQQQSEIITYYVLDNIRNQSRELIKSSARSCLCANRQVNPRDAAEDSFCFRQSILIYLALNCTDINRGMLF